MRILFVGINPHYGSFSRGIPFSNNKMFWYLLNRSGAINEKEDDLKDDTKLRRIYLRKFSRVYNYGFMNIIDRPTRVVTELKKGEESNGRKKIIRAIDKFRPRIVCFIGKITYEKFKGSKDFDFGWQPDVLSSKAYVMHFPIRGKASIRVRDLRVMMSSDGDSPNRPPPDRSNGRNLYT